LIANPSQQQQSQQQQSQQQQLPRRVCLASSTDHPTEIIEHVLTPVTEVIPFRRVGLFQFDIRKWWSSRPSLSQDTTETLVFALNCPLAMIHQITLRPLLDPFTADRVYTWNHTQIKAYRFPLSKLDPNPSHARAGFPCTVPVDHVPMEDEDDWTVTVRSENDKRAMDALLSEQEEPLYASEWTATQIPPMARDTGRLTVEDQHFTFPVGVMANVICIRLAGKQHRQFETSGYYACLEHVSIQGIPLARPNHPHMKAIG
jgi:hypothetical protein